MSSNHPCPFCQIAAGKLAAEVVYRDEQVTAFKDIRPVTPTHILIIPNRHITSINDASDEDQVLLGHMTLVAKRIAGEVGLIHSGYRLVINTGPDAGQSVFHLHLHLIGGRRMPFHFRAED